MVNSLVVARLGLNDVDVAWIAGLLEGEGWFGCNSKRDCLKVELAMTDGDVVDRFAGLVGVESRVRTRRKPHWKDQYLATVYGAKAEELMRRILPFMGERRRDTIELVLEELGK